MAEVTHIAPAVTHRRCPTCGYVMSQLEVDLARFDFKCPRCAKHTLREFQPINWPTNEASMPSKKELLKALTAHHRDNPILEELHRREAEAAGMKGYTDCPQCKGRGYWNALNGPVACSDCSTVVPHEGTTP